MEAFKPLQSIKCCALQRATPYCPYGYRKSEGHLTSWLGFNGEPQDQQSDYYMLGRGYRAYNPRLMRFHSPDSLSPFGKGGINSYAYCAGDPVNFADPSGHLTPQKRNSQRSRATSSRRPSLTSEFESRAQQQGTTGAADLIARALTLLQELRQRLQHRPRWLSITLKRPLTRQWRACKAVKTLRSPTSRRRCNNRCKLQLRTQRR